MDCEPRAANIMFRSTACALRARFAADLELIDAGAQRLAQLAEAAREADARLTRLLGPPSRKPAVAARPVSTRPCTASLRRYGSNARSSPPISRAPSPDTTGTDRVEFGVQTNPGDAAGAADEGCIGR